MGASSAEIDQEIRATREELEETIGVLERRAATGARFYARVAAGVAAAAAVVVVGVIIYRRRRHKNAVKQLFESVRDLPVDVTSSLKKKLPIRVTISGRDDDSGAPGAWTGIAGKIGPSLVGSATGAVLARLRGTPDEASAAE
jgi:hypothetical protein